MADKTDGQVAPKKITKIEAVRQALAHFGKDAKPTQMQGWIKDTFNIEMNTDHISTSKGDILRKAAAAANPADAPAAPTAIGTASPAQNQGKPETKIEGVQLALAVLGKKAKPLTIKDYVKTHFGIDISAEVARNYKKVLAKRAKERRAAKAKPAAAAQTAPKPAGRPSASAGMSSIPLPDILVVKDLMGRLGTKQLQTLIDLFAK